MAGRVWSNRVRVLVRVCVNRRSKKKTDVRWRVWSNRVRDRKVPSKVRHEERHLCRHKFKKKKSTDQKKMYRAKSDMNAIYIGTNFEKFVYAVILCGKYTSDFT